MSVIVFNTTNTWKGHKFDTTIKQKIPTIVLFLFVVFRQVSEVTRDAKPSHYVFKDSKGANVFLTFSS